MLNEIDARKRPHVMLSSFQATTALITMTLHGITTTGFRPVKASLKEVGAVLS